MADNNRNRSYFASDENRDQNQGSNYRQNDFNQGQGDYGNTNYNKENSWKRNQGYGGTGGAGYGTGSGSSGYGQNFEGDYNYGSGRQDYDKSSRNYGASYGSGTYGGREEDWRRSDVNYGDHGRSNYRNDYGSQYGTGNYGQRDGSNYGQDYRTGNKNQNWQRSSGQTENRYGGDTRNHGNANQGGYDRDWWDRTRDEVSSWFGDDDAERRRRMDRQENPMEKQKTWGSHRGKGPKDYQRSEDRIREDVCDRLSDDDRLDASDIQVQVQGTEVILSGNVNNREEKRRAEDLVESISGVRNVENRIRISHGNERSNW